MAEAALGRALVWAGAIGSLAGAAHATFNARRLRHLGAAGAVHERVSVLVPARDEALTIGECVRRLRQQTGIPDLELVVLDDDSTDGTAAEAERAADGDGRVRVHTSRSAPPPGWLGKPFACARLAAESSGSVLVFVDADVRLETDAVAAAVGALRASRAELVSAWPRQVAVSPLARLVQPLQQWSWLTTLPLRAARESHRESLTAANGQFLVADAAAYRSAGGHAAVRGDVLDDIALARAFKRAGLRVDLADASAVASCRMYDTDRSLVDGYAKSLWKAFGGPRRGIAVASLLALVYTLPPGYAVFGRHRGTRLAGAAAYAAGVASRVASAGATGSRVWPDALTQPVSIAAFAGLMLVSVSRHRAGTLRWRGRPVDSSPP